MQGQGQGQGILFYLGKSLAHRANILGIQKRKRGTRNDDETLGSEDSGEVKKL